MNCPNCRTENPEGIKYCGECGAALIPSQAKSPIDFQEPQSYTPKHLADKILTSRSLYY